MFAKGWASCERNLGAGSRSGEDGLGTERERPCVEGPLTGGSQPLAALQRPSWGQKRVPPPLLWSLSQTSSWCSRPMASLSQELEGKGSFGAALKGQGPGPAGEGAEGSWRERRTTSSNRTNNGGKGAHPARAWMGLLPRKRLR